MRAFAFALAILFSACSSPPPDVDVSARGKADSTADGIARVAPGIFRGARPGAPELHKLAAMGVRTIVDLENDEEAVAAEARVARQLGLRFEREPLSPFLPPDDAEIDRILALLGDARLRPLFVHCKYGEDRTGLVVGLYRVLDQGWAPEIAYREMLRFGFHRALLALDHYYKEKTGME